MHPFTSSLLLHTPAPALTTPLTHHIPITGGYTADTVKQDLQHISELVQMRRKTFKAEAAERKASRTALEAKLSTSSHAKEEPFKVASLFPTAEQVRVVW